MSVSACLLTSSVRAGPFLAIVALLAGLLLGRLALRTRGTSGRESGLLLRLGRLEERLREHADDRAYLDDQLVAAEKAIVDNDVEKATQLLTAIEGGATILAALRECDEAVTEPDPVTDELVADIRHRVDAGSYDVARQRLEQLRARVRESQQPSPARTLGLLKTANAEVAAERVVAATAKPSKPRRFCAGCFSC